MSRNMPQERRDALFALAETCGTDAEYASRVIGEMDTTALSTFVTNIMQQLKLIGYHAWVEVQLEKNMRRPGAAS